MTVPKNVLWFEVLLYLSLILDALTTAFQSRTPDAEITQAAIFAANAIAAALILFFAWLVQHAARKRKKWPRSVLAGALAFSVISLMQLVGETGLRFEISVEIFSSFLTAAGLYFSYSGDAKGWFNA